MIKTGFRPSDDPNDLPYNIPGNAMMCTYMQLVAEKVLEKIPGTSVFYTEASILINQMTHLAKQIK